MTSTHPEQAAARTSAGAWRAELDRLLGLDLGPLPVAQAAELDRIRARLSAAPPADSPDDVPDEGRIDAHRDPAPLATVAAGDLDITLADLETVQAQIARLEALRAALAARLVGQATVCEDALLDTDVPAVSRADVARRRELAHRAVVADVAAALHLGETAAGSLLDHSCALVTCAPRMLALLAEGRTSWRHASLLATHVGDLDAPAARAVESGVLHAAATSTPAQFARAVRRARDLAHPTPLDVRHAEALRTRGVWVDPGKDGMAWLTAHLPAPHAHAVADRLDTLADRLHAAGDPRGRGELRADALTDLLLDDGTLDLTLGHVAPSTAPNGHGPADTEHHAPAALGSLAPVARAIRPRVNVTVPVLSLLGITDAPAVLDGHVPIDAETARALCAHAPSFRRVLTHPETGVVLSVGRRSYAVPADLRALLAERDATCRFPGCTRPAGRSDVDHTVAWADGGQTRADNLAHLCRRHHVMKHSTRWTVRQVTGTTAGVADGTAGSLDGTLEWTSPTGRIHATAPTSPETTRHRTPPRPLVEDGDPPPF
ncbi:DUF222 domain-containing protein [Isoptericola sp. F-RaC21]|uniref:HNH endonuclease signature motif containing protein n=1 Tax=Isoptericola sp. F-RaC21 TaxID=3141452 RepID=UPI00315C488A